MGTFCTDAVQSRLLQTSDMTDFAAFANVSIRCLSNRWPTKNKWGEITSPCVRTNYIRKPRGLATRVPRLIALKSINRKHYSASESLPVELISFPRAMKHNPIVPETHSPQVPIREAFMFASHRLSHMGRINRQSQSLGKYCAINPRS